MLLSKTFKQIVLIIVGIGVLVFGISVFCRKSCIVRPSDNVSQENKVEAVNLENGISDLNKSKNEGESIEIVFVGDIMLGRFVDKKIKAYDMKLGTNTAPFIDSGVRSILQKADIAVGNLESPFGIKGPHDNLGIVFNADPNYAERLNGVGFDILSTANNHSMDQGHGGIDNTIKVLSLNNISPIGTSAIELDADCHKGVIKEVKGKRFGFLSYSYTAYNYGGHFPDNKVCDWGDFETVKSDVIDLRKRSDYIIVMAHTGVENSTDPTEEDKDKFKALADLGVSMVIGHHPHVLQKVEMYKGSVLAYSLGNFIFDQVEEAQKKSAILRVKVSSSGDFGFEIVPVKISDLCCSEL